MALKELKQNADIVIKPADKGSAIVIMDRDDYVLEAERQLNVSKHYKEISEPQFPKNCEIFNRILETMRLKKVNLKKGIELSESKQKFKGTHLISTSKNP